MLFLTNINIDDNDNDNNYDINSKHLSVQFKKVFIVNPHFKRHITEKHYTVIVTKPIGLN